MGGALGEPRGLLQYRYPVIVYQYYLAHYLVAGGTGILGGVFNFLRREKVVEFSRRVGTSWASA